MTEEEKHTADGNAGNPNEQLEDLIESEPLVHDASQTTIDALEAVVSALRDSNDRLRQRLESDWKLAKTVLVITALVVSLIFGSNLYREFVAVSELRERSKDLKERIDSSQEQTAAAEMANEKLLKDWDNLSLATKIEISEIREADSKERILQTLVDGAQDQMYFRRNPQRALSLIEKAEDILSLLCQSLETNSQNKQLVEIFSPVILAHKVEVLWTLGDVEQIEIEAKRGVDDDNPSLDVQYYYGLARLYRSFDVQDEASRVALRSGAIQSLEMCVRNVEDGGLAQIFLAAAYLDARQYPAVIRHCERFLRAYPIDLQAKQRLNSDTKAQLALANVWYSISDFILHPNTSGVTTSHGCSIDAGAIGFHEAVLFEKVLERTIRCRNEIADRPDSALRIGVFCCNVLQSVHSARVGCMSPGTPASADPILKYEIFPLASRDKTLGREIDGKLRMKYMELIHEDGRVVGYRFEELTPDDEGDIPEQRYLAWDLAPTFSHASESTAPQEAPVGDEVPPAPVVDPSA